MAACFDEAGLGFSELYKLDRRNQNEAQMLIWKSDLIILSGGHVPTQNAFFRDIGLKALLENYQGVILGIAMTMRIDLTHMDHFIQWKNFESGEYVMGLEPANSSLGGRAVQKKLGDIKTIAPKSKVRIVTEIEFEKLI